MRPWGRLICACLIAWALHCVVCLRHNPKTRLGPALFGVTLEVTNGGRHVYQYRKLYIYMQGARSSSASSKLIRARHHYGMMSDVALYVHYLNLHSRVYSNGALENRIIKLDTINTQAFVLPPRNPACKALTFSHFDGHRHVGGHGSRPAAEAEGDCRSYRHARTEQ